MKQFFVIIAVLFLAGAAQAQPDVNTVFSAKAFAKASTNVDTSASIAVSYSPYIYLQTQSTGSDSTKLYIAVDGLTRLGNWALAIARDTLTLGRPAGWVLDSAHGQWHVMALRTISSDLLQGVTAIRVRNTHASGSGDSVSALTYSEWLISRRY